MDAKEARKRTDKVLKLRSDAFQNLFRQQQAQKKKSFDDLVIEKATVWTQMIESEILKGLDYIEFAYPGGEFYEALKEHFEKLGYRVNTFETDEGYCIGYVTHVSVRW